MLSVLLAFIVILLCLWIFIKRRILYDDSKYKNLPQGPAKHPIFGHVMLAKPRSYDYVNNISNSNEAYRHVVRIYALFTRVYVLNSYAAVREAFIAKADNFSGRPPNVVQDPEVAKYGVVFIDGHLWKEQRRFLLRILRDFGFGKERAENIIQKEATDLIRIITENSSSPITTETLLSQVTSNVISQLMMSKRNKLTLNPKMQASFQRSLNAINELISIPMIFDFNFVLSFTQYIPKCIKDRIPEARRANELIAQAMQYLSKQVKKHRKKFDSSQEPSDFIDAFLLEEQNKNGEFPSHYTNEQLVKVLFETFVGGTDTTTHSLNWAFLFMACHQDIQEKVYQELCRNYDKDAQISYKDRNRLSYVQAVLEESQRVATIAPFALNHRNFCDDVIQGLDIPANSVVVPNIFRIHRDPEFWEQPDKFYPEHFLTSNGEFRAREQLLTFSVGKRVCPGESLARNEYFVFFTAVLRKFRLQLDRSGLNGENDLDKILRGQEGSIRRPGHHKILFVERDN